MSYFEKLKRFLHIKPSYDPSLIIRDVAYFSGSDAHVNHKLDIFLPSSKADVETNSYQQGETVRKALPVIVHIHGGGWVRGSRRSESRGGPAISRTCAEEGFVGVVVSYRLARISAISFFAWAFIFGLIIIIIGLGLLSWELIVGYVTFMVGAYAYNFLYRVRTPVNIDHMLDDLSYALIYIREHINEHCPDADPNQIFLTGHSAGAHLISLLTLDKSHLLRHNFPLSSISGVISISGIYSLANPTHDSHNNVRSWVFRILYSSNLLYPRGRKMNEYSPIEYIKEGEEIPPFLVLSAKYDMGLEVDAKRFVEKFRSCHQPVEYFTVEGSHGSIATKFAKNNARKHFFEFVRQHMKY
ncbi:unnamed protein product [Adineta steineri]|uniref:BD-FAE-like domain-containing protein n=1 Tax=Adineta steineri TaxID=433720 RepID=A0A814CEH6_9BILA|nr:unnamed protein product [Adineta steineri]CAF1060293.1 unnamed protein product [Adineta steineri]